MATTADVWPKTVPKDKHPIAIIHPEPIRISPLVRLARWSALGLGIMLVLTFLKFILI